MFPLLVGVEAFLQDIMNKRLMNYQPDRCCIYQARNGPCEIRKTKEALLLRMEPSFPKEEVLLVLKFAASSSLHKLVECPLEFVTSSQDLVQCSLWQH
jgi:hypothetical protein